MKMKIPTTGTGGNGFYGPSSPYVSSSDGSSENGHQEEMLGLADSPTLDGDFSEYMWMENEEEFDKQVMQQLEEEALMEQCIEAMLEDEREREGIRAPPSGGVSGGSGGGHGHQTMGNNAFFYSNSHSHHQHQHHNHRHQQLHHQQQQQQQGGCSLPQPTATTRQPWSDNTVNGLEICNGMESLRVQDQDELAKQSTLNPNAAEFVPQQRQRPAATIQSSTTSITGPQNNATTSQKKAT